MKRSPLFTDEELEAIKHPYFPTNEEIESMFQSHDVIKITDERDREEIKRRKLKKTFQPSRDELYSCNPDFDGVYSDPQCR